MNPAGFLYCGYCAAPMENTEIRARIAEVAAPDGGWPNLSAELIEVKFFLQQGHLDEAYDLLSILQRRYPGHPDLADLSRGGGSMKPDRQVEELVDSVLAGSADLGGPVPRRRVPKWDAPAMPGARKLTTSNSTVPAAKPRKSKPASPKARKEPTRVYRAAKPGAKPPPLPKLSGPQSGMTVAVATLQPAAPFETELPETNPRKKGKGKGKGKGKKEARGTETGPKRATKTSRKRKPDPADGERKRNAPSFGAGVLSRFGR